MNENEGKGSSQVMSSYDVKREVSDRYSLRGRVFHRLREDILNGKYKEHEELKEVAIGEELGLPAVGIRGPDPDCSQ